MTYTTVEVAGEELAVSFGNAALRRFEKRTGLNALELGENLNYNTILELVYAALVEGARKAKVEFNLSVEEMCDLLDEDPEALGKLMNTYSESMPQVEPGKKGRRRKR